MPNRILRDGILESLTIHTLSPMAELFYRRLMSVVDDFGRYGADVPVLLSRCYPRRAEWATEDSVIQWLTECSEAELITLYTVDGHDYLEIAKFDQRTRSVSRYPSPDGLKDSEVRSGKVYFIQAAESKRIKIGYTECKPESRLLSLQTGAHERLILLGFMPGTLKEERDIHKRFSVESLGGEWFSPSSELLKFVEESKIIMRANDRQSQPSTRATTPSPSPTVVEVSKSENARENGVVVIPPAALRSEEFQELVGIFLSLGVAMSETDTNKCARSWIQLDLNEQLACMMDARKNRAGPWSVCATRYVPRPWNYLDEKQWCRRSAVKPRERSMTAGETAQQQAERMFMEGT